jgi:flavorubredoxin
MKSMVLHDDGHTWVVLGRDPERPEKIIDTNQYLIRNGERTLLVDPGGIEIFSAMLGETLRHTHIDQVTDLFASHQDPDIISSLGLWDVAVPNARLHAPWLWEGFLRHFGLNSIEYSPLADEGATLHLGDLELQAIPAHYLHASGNFHLYDPKAKILMSGDVGAALEKGDVPMFVEDFDRHVRHMQLFHQRWMPSNRAKRDWIRRIRQLDIEIMAPQHGRLFRGADVQRFLDWFDELEVGTAIAD